MTSAGFTGNTMDETDNFRIEDKMHHRVDTDLSVGTGLITWVAGNLYVTAPRLALAWFARHRFHHPAWD